jgi:hypothetical protein
MPSLAALLARLEAEARHAAEVVRTTRANLERSRRFAADARRRAANARASALRTRDLQRRAVPPAPPAEAPPDRLRAGGE